MQDQLSNLSLAPGAVALRAVRLTGLTSFPDPIELDLEKLGPGLVALTGRNGEGKSTILEAVMASLYRSLPSYPGSIYQSANGPGYVESDWATASGSVVARLTFDPGRRSSEAFLSVDGTIETRSGHMDEFDAAVVRRFGSESLVLASVFSAQNRAGNFFALKRAERKQLFAELLSLGRWSTRAEAARTRLVAAEAELAATRSDLARLGERVGLTVEGAESAVGLAADGETVADRRVVEAQALYDDAVAAQAAAIELGRSILEADRAVMSAQQRRDLAAAELKQVAEVATQRRVELQDRLSRARADLARAESEPACSACPTAAEVADFEARCALLEAEREQLLGELPKRDELSGAVSASATARAALDQAEARLHDVESRSALIAEVPCAAGEARWLPLEQLPTIVLPGDAYRWSRDFVGGCPLLLDARQAQAALSEIRHAVAVAQQSVLAATQREAELKTKDDEVRKRGTAVAARLNAQRQVLAVHRAQLAASENHAQAVAAARAKVAQAEAACGAAEPDSDSATEALQRALDRWVCELGVAIAARAALPESSGVAAAEALLAARRNALADTQRDLRAATAALATARAALEQANQVQALRIALTERIERAVVSASDAALLARAVGKDGVPALEIDAAGPAVSAVANDLMEHCSSGRYSLRFETLREKRDGTYAEDFDVRVFDGGAERQADRFSGGQRVIFGEAIGLAVAAYNAQRSGVRWATMFRDETAGALDPENAAAYVTMLRRAMALGQFRNVVFVSHVPAVWSSADAIVRVDAGRLQVES